MRFNFQAKTIPSKHTPRRSLHCILQRIAAFVEQRNGDVRASGTRRLAEHIDRSFMRFHGGLLCDHPQNGRPFLSPSPSLSLSLSLSLSISGSATSTYFRIARNWHAATAAALAGRSTKLPWLTSAAFRSITSCVFHVAVTKIHLVAGFRGRPRVFLFARSRVV